MHTNTRAINILCMCIFGYVALRSVSQFCYDGELQPCIVGQMSLWHGYFNTNCRCSTYCSIVLPPLVRLSCCLVGSVCLLVLIIWQDDIIYEIDIIFLSSRFVIYRFVRFLYRFVRKLCRLFIWYVDLSEKYVIIWMANTEHGRQF